MDNEKKKEILNKEHYGMEDLREIVAILRSEQGCPWDKEQNHASIRKNLIEETYEVVEAIDTQDIPLLQEELGDVLLQVVFHAQMEEELEHFTLSDVANDICKKLIVRHPHVFGDTLAENVNQVLINWDAIKKEQKKQTSTTEVLESISKALPALMRADKLVQKAAKADFDFTPYQEKRTALQEMLDTNQKDKMEEEIGDVLFALSQVARTYHVDSERALYRACDKFIGQFQKIESTLA